MNKEILEEKKWIYGYKALFDGMLNQYNQKFELGCVYTDDNIEKNGGFHFCKNLEDIFIFPQFRNDVSIYKVCGSGKIIPYHNDYYDLYDVYAVEKIKIIQEISRNEIIKYYLSLDNVYQINRILRFIQLFSLYYDEIELFKIRYKDDMNILNYIAYYQEGDKDIFKRMQKIR